MINKLLVIIFICAALKSQGQTWTPAIALDNYLFNGKKKVGRLYCFSSPGAKFKLVSNKDGLKIRKGHQLYLTGKAKKRKGDRFRVTVRASDGRSNWETSFVILKDSFVRNKVIAHRGAWKNVKVPQNSLASLQHAIDLSCEGSEFDVHLSADSVVFLNHDHNIGNIYIEKTGANELSKVALANAESLPQLSNFLALGTSQHTTKLILEIKASAISKERSLALARKVVEEVYKAGAQAWMVYISFDYDVLQEILRVDPFAKVAYLKGDVPPQKLAGDKMYGFSYHFSVLQKNTTWISECHQLGLKANVWTVNNPDLIDYFLQAGADFITTDEPEVALQKARQKKK